MILNPTYDRVLVRRLEGENKTSSGIYIPESSTDKTQFAHVIAVGTGKLMANGQIHQLTVKVGDKVLLGKYAGTEVKCDNIEYLIIKEDEILGIIEE